MPADITLDRVRGLLAHGHDVGHVLEVALAAALAKAKATLDARWRQGPPAAEEAARQFLLAAQAAGEELDRLYLAVAEGLDPQRAEG